MKRILVALILAVSLTACIPKSGHGGSYTEENFNVICLDNTEYWIRIAGHSGAMAVKIDPKTQKPAACKSRYPENCSKAGNVLTCPLPE